MGRWIAFDEESTAIAAAESGMAVSFQRGDAFETALATAKPATVILPGSTSEDVLVVELMPGQKLTGSSPRQVAGRQSDEEPVSYEATGFLGLSDEPVFEEKPAPAKRWWKRILD